MRRSTLIAVATGSVVLGTGAIVLAFVRRRISLAALADSIAAEQGVNAAIVKATVAAESAWRPEAKNCTGGDGARGCAWGLLQITADTARDAGYTGPIAGLLDPTTNLRLGARLMAAYQRTWNDRDAMRYRIAWRFGPGRAAQWPPQGEAAAVAAAEGTYRAALRRYGWTGAVWPGDVALSGPTVALLRLRVVA